MNRLFLAAAFVVVMLAASMYSSRLSAQGQQVVTVPVTRQEFGLIIPGVNDPATWTFTLAETPKSGYQVDVYRCQNAFAGDGVYRGCTMMRSPWENWATAEFQIEGCCVIRPRAPQNNTLMAAAGDHFVFRYLVDRNFPVQ